MPGKRILLGIFISFAAACALHSYAPGILNPVKNPEQREAQFDNKANEYSNPHFRRAFQDYPAAVATGPLVSPNFDGTTNRYNKYRTAIKLAVNAGPNFAGHFAIVEIGCGTSCTIPFIVDLSNGEISEFPLEIGIIPDITYAYQKESSLLVALWPLDVFTSKPRCKRLYYQRKSRNFVKIEEAVSLGECHSQSINEKGQ